MNKNICIFCSSSNAIDEKYSIVAKELAYTIAKNRQTLLFGGSNVGLMKQIADSVRVKGGNIIGVIPEKIKSLNLACENLDELIVTKDMFSRKSKLTELADAFIALPGGFGTLDELSEVITLKQLGYHNKPIIILNLFGFFNFLIKQFEEFYDQDFSKSENKTLYFVTDQIADAFKYIRNYENTESVNKWY